MAVNVYLVFNGNAEEALHLYADAFKTTINEINRFSSMPGYENHIPAGFGEKIMHANLDIAGSKVMFSDTLPEHEHVVGTNVTVAVITSNKDLIQHSFQALATEGQVTLELQQTPWSPLYGQVTDKFGVIWQMNLEE